MMVPTRNLMTWGLFLFLLLPLSAAAQPEPQPQPQMPPALECAAGKTGWRNICVPTGCLDGVRFADMALESAARKAVGLPQGELTLAHTARTTMLTARGVGIEQLDGIECFVNLKRLRLFENKIVDLTPLGSLSRLEELALDNNRLADVAESIGEQIEGEQNEESQNKLDGDAPQPRAPVLTPLAGLSSLRSLTAAHNQIVDLTPLAGLPELRVLVLTGNRIERIDPLVGLSHLSRVELGKNRIIDLTALAGLGALSTLALCNNQIADLGPLSGLPGLTFLHLSHNQIDDTLPLAPLGTLTRLHLTGNKIVELQPLAALAEMRILLIGDNQVADYTPLGGLEKLRHLHVWGNPVSFPRDLLDKLHERETQVHVGRPARMHGVDCTL